jgi:uncharacterized delta-60 repeat protein
MDRSHAIHLPEVIVSTRRRVTRTLVPIALIATVALLAGGVASAAPGDVDASFGDAGSKTISLSSAADVGGIVRRSDGSFVIGASATADAYTIALKSNGQPLMSYGIAGVASITVPGALAVTITDIATRSNDATVVVGYDSAMSGSDRFVIAKFRANGEPDLTFSDDGVTRIGFPQGDAYGYGVAIQPDGKIVVVGEVDPNMNSSNPAILRLNANGTVDKTFANHGRKVVRLNDGQGYDGVWRVVIQSGGKIAMAGWQARGNNNYKTLAIRLKPGGVLDKAFGGDGVVVVDADGTDNWAYGLAKDGDKLVLGLHASSNAAGFLRLTANGKRDTSFGGDGVAMHALSVPWEVDGVAVRNDHRVVGVNGYSGGPNAVMLKAGGKLEGSFGSGGEAVGPLTDAFAYGVTLMPNGKIVLAGNSSSDDVIAVRFLGL